MDQSNKKLPADEQFLYLGRWVSKRHFRAFVYDREGNHQLANSYQEFESLTNSGIWFASKPEASSPKRKQKHEPVCPTS